MRRPAVRLLHARLCRGRASLPEFQTKGDGRRNSQGPERQPLPLRDLCQRHSSGPQGRERRRLMAVEYSWPAKEKSHAIGTRVKRVDGMAKATGAAKNTYDVNLKNQLIAKGLGCPHAHCRIKSIDVAPALKVPGVVYAEPVERTAGKPVKSGDEIEFQGELLVVVAAETEAAAREGINAVQIEYEQLPVFVKDSDLAAAKEA